LRRRQEDGPGLSPGILIEAYAKGYFPMAEGRDGPILWYSPDPRAIIPLDGFKASRSLRQRVRKQTYEIRIDTAFEEVINSCAGRDDTWISGEIVRGYTALFKEGFVHSVESWHNGVLAGGLYGVSIGGAFFGESMFSRATDASKVALVALVQHLRERNFLLLDSQIMNEHIRQFGALEISRMEYLRVLRAAINVETNFTAAVLERQ
jgi:leucyl/phenylalanyl-tRNA---protein transferase